MTPLELKALRHSLGLPQEDFARALGLSRTTLIALEQGRAQVGRSLLLALAAYTENLPLYRADPAHVRVFLASERKRINRTDPDPDLPFQDSRLRRLA